MDFDDLQGEHRYNRWRAYRQSKLANLMFTYELARRLEGQGVTVNALHPGFVATEIGTRHNFVPSLFWRIGTMAAISPERGAQTILHLACAAEVADVTGGYFIDNKPARSSSASYDRKAADRLWDISLNLTGLPDL
jgi:NAD(P)-dependent dehydrogenase (short-subunit alcohol dehydrogenase family)